MSKLTRALAGAVVAGALMSAPAMASETVIVDGKARDAAELMALKGKLNVVQAKAGEPTVAFTSKAKFKAYLREQLGVDLDKPHAAKAKASWAGDYALFYELHDGYGPSYRLDSGKSDPDLHHTGFLWLFNYGDKFSSVRTVGRAALLYSETNYRGTQYYVGPNLHHEIAPWFDNTASSAKVIW